MAAHTRLYSSSRHEYLLLNGDIISREAIVRGYVSSVSDTCCKVSFYCPLSVPATNKTRGEFMALTKNLGPHQLTTFIFYYRLLWKQPH